MVILSIVLFVVCQLAVFSKRDLFNTPKKREIITHVRQNFQRDSYTGEMKPSERCKNCRNIDLCQGYMDTKYPYNKSLPDFPCDTENVDVLQKLYVEIVPACEMYEDFDYSDCTDCEHCKNLVKIPDCDVCPAKRYCDGVQNAKAAISDMICHFYPKA